MSGFGVRGRGGGLALLMESGFGVGRYRGDVVANLGAGFASFLPPAEDAICAEIRSCEQ